ncbi:MAG: hypothetical protein GF331_22030 [Chitinivibrionales bacterium]|nr:hypothetical protein [Chitinivibrionales bacterium]
MLRIMKAENGMHLMGQGAKILIFTAPAAAGAGALHLLRPDLAALPTAAAAFAVAGYPLLALGVGLWLTALVQLLHGFPKGELVTGGAYGVCRNPIYASVAIFMLPGIALLSQTWVYAVVSLALLTGVAVFIGKEERELQAVFGARYAEYTRSVHRIVPLLAKVMPKRD